MNEDDIDWRQQEESEQRQFEEEQELLKADPGYFEWLAALSTKHAQEFHHERIRNQFELFDI